eukprot:COSAG03_NODE_15029_length_443_cov_1.052326_1_plen_73_part_10
MRVRSASSGERLAVRWQVLYANGVLGALVLFEMAMLLVLPELRSWDAVLHHFACCAVRSPAAQDPPVRSPVIS